MLQARTDMHRHFFLVTVLGSNGNEVVRGGF